jgi:hypothetical protein
MAAPLKRAFEGSSLCITRGGTTVYNEGRYIMYDEAPELRRERIKRDQEFCETILAKCEN